MNPQQAKEFAIAAHGNQKRKYTGEPYWHHLEEVAQIITGYKDEYVVCAAYLHDVLEDTKITVEQLLSIFGPSITNLVVELTDVYTKSNYPALNRKERKSLEARRLSSCHPAAQTIKCADAISNAKSIFTHDPKFAPVFCQEMWMLYHSLHRVPWPLAASLQQILMKYEDSTRTLA